MIVMPFFLENLKREGFLDNLPMTVCNVGSRKLSQEDDYPSKGWEIFAPNLTIYGFDADEDACELANQNIERRQINWQERHLPVALSSRKGESTLYVTKHPMCSSLYPPNEPFLRRFNNLPELAGLDFTVEIETTTSDNKQYNFADLIVKKLAEIPEIAGEKLRSLPVFSLIKSHLTSV